MLTKGPTKDCTNITTPAIVHLGPGPFGSLCNKACLCWYAEASAAASNEAYHSLQVRQQALQDSLAEQSLQSIACQSSLNQQLHSLQSQVTAVKQERDAAMTGVKALQMCHEKSRCSLHVGLSQVNSADMHMHTDTHACRLIKRFIRTQSPWQLLFGCFSTHATCELESSWSCEAKN